jgi:hypothetical protein
MWLFFTSAYHLKNILKIFNHFFSIKNSVLMEAIIKVLFLETFIFVILPVSHNF